MCGICGLVSLEGAPVDGAVVRAMAASIRHRGPDDEGTFVEGNAGLGHTRLSIIDLSSAGHQPMLDASRETVIVFNGEIYNYRDLRRELLADGAPLRTHSDTEVILYLFRKHGVECLKHLRGMFAFAIWDRGRKRLFLARDRIGIKPLYYYLDDRWFVFASEMKAINQVPHLDRELSQEAISTYFAYGHSFAPQTIFARIRKLAPGHWMMIEGREPVIQRYWDVPSEVTETKRTLKERTEELAGVLNDSVRCHVIADVPVGLFLSGGVDSSLIGALATRQKGEGLQTFSAGFDVGGHYNELSAARLVARHINADHHELVVRSLDVPALLERLVWHYDEPFADAACIPTYLISEFARQKVKVVLSGEGGDEVFGGYRRYIAHRASRYYRRLSWLSGSNSALRKMVDSRKGLRRVRKVFESAGITDEAELYAHWVTSFTAPMRQQLFAGALQQFDKWYDATQPYRRHFAAGGGDPVNRLLLADLKLWLPDTYLEKVDKASMAVGLEVRVPLLDHRVVEYAFSLPGGYKISLFRKKYLLRKTASKLLPWRILAKPKHGFSVPLDEWFRGPLLSYARDILLDGSVGRRGYFNVSAIEGLIGAHLERRRNYGSQIWLLLNFEMWHRCFVDNAPAAA